MNQNFTAWTSPIDPQNNSPDRCFSGVITPVATILLHWRMLRRFLGCPQTSPSLYLLLLMLPAVGTGATVAQSRCTLSSMHDRILQDGESPGSSWTQNTSPARLNKLYDVSPNKHVLSATATSLPGNHPTCWNYNNRPFVHSVDFYGHQVLAET